MHNPDLRVSADEFTQPKQLLTWALSKCLTLHRWKSLQKMSLNSVTAQMILLQCTGDEIWSVETCRQQGIPEQWIDELQGAFESGFDTDRNTIYEDGRMVNQYHGVLDLHLAYKLAELLGIDWQRVTATALGRQAEVAAIKAELDEL